MGALHVYQSYERVYKHRDDAKVADLGLRARMTESYHMQYALSTNISVYMDTAIDKHYSLAFLTQNSQHYSICIPTIRNRRIYIYRYWAHISYFISLSIPCSQSDV